ncbi:MAG: GNAT family protein [Rhodobacter sp.]|nr:GNAT family protein [Rhodobacter sp.]
MRPLLATDTPEIARIGGDRRVARMIFAATVPWPEVDVARFVAYFAWTGALPFRLAICLPEGPLIGTVGASEDAHVFYFVDPAHWGNGYATEAMNGFLPAVMDGFGLAEVHADVFTDNVASHRVLEKLGFRRTGTGAGTSAARLEPAPVIVYRLDRSSLEART